MGQRTTTPVVRALLNPNSEAALEALRPLPRFGSFLGPVMREHVALCMPWVTATTRRRSVCFGWTDSCRAGRIYLAIR